MASSRLYDSCSIWHLPIFLCAVFPRYARKNRSQSKIEYRLWHLVQRLHIGRLDRLASAQPLGDPLGCREAPPTQRSSRSAADLSRRGVAAQALPAGRARRAVSIRRRTARHPPAQVGRNVVAHLDNHIHTSSSCAIVCRPLRAACSAGERQITLRCFSIKVLRFLRYAQKSKHKR